MGQLRLVNRSGYDTEDLRRYIRRGLRANRVRQDVLVIVVASPIRSRGCAEVGGGRMTLAIAAPGRTSTREFYRRFARLIDHECGHLNGYDHDQMRRLSRAFLYSEGPESRWSRGLRIRYRGRAPKQLALLGRRSSVVSTRSTARARAKRKRRASR